MAACVQLAPPAAHAGTETWRCGNTYTDQPCQGGKAIDPDDARDAAQRREADSATREARTAADRLERDRVRLEAAQGGRAATLIDNKPSNAKPDASPAPGVALKKKKKDPGYFSAHDPVATAKKKAAKKSAKS
ncbi:hypothetical protein J7E62_11070 [Variovorax paradoxus]|nr:hypothetical protein [Variovorax paradoxus]